MLALASYGAAATGFGVSRLGKQNVSSTSCRAQGKDADRVVTSGAPDSPRSWGRIGLSLFGAGFMVGPVLDGLHSRVELIVYKNGAIDLGSLLHTNVWVFPLLGTFYSVAGLLLLALDGRFSKAGPLVPSFKRILISLFILALYLELSAELYKAGVPYNIEAYILFAAGQLNWAFLESTWWGFGLASLAGIVCPLAEVPFVKWFNLWHYSKPDIYIFDEGSVSWVVCCYFAYIPFLANLSRWLRAYYQQVNSRNS